MEIKLMYQNYYENSLIHKARGTCEYENSKIKRILRLLNAMGLYQTSQIDKNALNAVISRLKPTCSNKTINKLILITKQAYKFNGLSFDYLEKFPKLKESKRRFDIIEQNELKLIMNHISKLDSKTDNNLMYQCIATMLLDTGMRANELMNVEIKNIDMQQKIILLTTTKTKRDRHVFFSKLSENYIKLMMQKGPKRERLIYNFLKDRLAHERDLIWLVTKLKNELQIDKLHPHMFRHTFATLAYNNGLDVFVLKELLGHENIATTQIYTHITKERLKAAYSKAFSSISSELKN
jgi:integrase/recombinase XerC